MKVLGRELVITLGVMTRRKLQMEKTKLVVTKLDGCRAVALTRSVLTLTLFMVNITLVATARRRTLIIDHRTWTTEHRPTEHGPQNIDPQNNKSPRPKDTKKTITVTDGHLLRGKSITVKDSVKETGHAHADIGVTHCLAMSHVSCY